MQAVWLENNHLDLREVPSPSRQGEVLVRVRLTGICGTDLELVRGYYPYTGIPGHEFVGEVVGFSLAASPPGDGSAPIAVGTRVVGEINAACGECEQCLHGRSMHCEKRSVLGIIARDGVFAEYVNLPLKNLHPVPDSVPDEMAVFCEPLAAALEIQQQVHIQPGQSILLVGAGRLGQLVAQTLVLTGANLRVLARHAIQKKLLTDRGIALVDEDAILPRHYDVVVEATGSTDGFEIARKAVRPRGNLVLKSTYKGDISLNMSAIVVDEINLTGSRCGPFEPALRLMEQKLVDPTVLVAEQYSLSQALQAFDSAARAGMLKVLIKP